MSTQSFEPSVGEVAASYSFNDQSYATHPFDLWKKFREAPGLSRSEQDGGFWILSRFQEVRDAATQEDLFCARLGRALPPHPGVLLPSDADGTLHRQYRRILNPWMTANAMEPMTQACHETCADLLAPLARRSEFDISQEYASPAILINGLKWLGWPVADAPQLGKWAHDMLAPRVDEETTTSSWQNLTAYITRSLEQRRGERRDDIIQAILDAQIDERPITDDEALQLVISVFLGAVDTTGSALAFSLYWLAEHPEERNLLRAEPERIPLAVEEFLRVAGTIAYLARTATQDTELDGCPISKGDRVALLFSSANRDAGVFPDPDKVILDRQPNRHMAFGHGPHKCSGAPFARMMLRIAIHEALQHLGEFKVSDPSAVDWESTQIRVLSRLPIVHQPR